MAGKSKRMRSTERARNREIAKRVRELEERENQLLKFETARQETLTYKGALDSISAALPAIKASHMQCEHLRDTLLEVIEQFENILGEYDAIKEELSHCVSLGSGDAQLDGTLLGNRLGVVTMQAAAVLNSLQNMGKRGMQ